MEVRSVEGIVRALNDAQVQYLVVSGLAVNAHGFVRLTRDVDIVLALEPANATRGLNALLAIGYRLSILAQPEEFADPKTREDWRANKRNDRSQTLERRAPPDAGRPLCLRTL